MRILITGADGYLGRFLVDSLVRERIDEIYTLGLEGAPVSPRRQLVKQHFCLGRSGSQAAAVREAIETVRPEAILHLAALVRITDPIEQLHEIVRSNIELGVLLLEHGSAVGLKYFVNTGTFWEEMNTRGTYCPVDLYAASKRAFQAFLPLYSSAHQLRSITLRMFGIFGPSDTRPNLFRSIDEAVVSGEPLDLSPGEQILELVYVKDACRAYECALEALTKMKEPGCLDPVEIGSGEGKRLREVVDLYTKVNGWDFEPRWSARDYRPREIMNRRADIEHADRMICWQPQYTLESAFLDIQQVQ